MIKQIVIGDMNHDEYKKVLLNSKCLRHSMNRIEGPEIGTLKKAFLSSIFLQAEQLLCRAYCFNFPSNHDIFFVDL